MFAKKHDTKEKISGLMLTYPINNRTFGVTKQIHSSMEQLLHYIWKHKMFPLHPLQTTAGEPVEVIDPGLHNIHAGPDFFNAKIKIGCTTSVPQTGSGTDMTTTRTTTMSACTSVPMWTAR